MQTVRHSVVNILKGKKKEEWNESADFKPSLGSECWTEAPYM